MRGNLCLLGAAFFWGTTFVAQMTGMDNLGPFTYAAARYFLGFISLWIIYYLFRDGRRLAKENGTYKPGWRAGLGAGLIMFVASSLQQVAMLYTTAGKTSFITCLYIILVPLASCWLGRRIRPENWLGAFLAVAGLYFLAIKDDFSLGLGDAIVLVGSFFWTAHILFIGKFAAMADAIEMSVTQIGVVTVLSLGVALAWETATWRDLQSAWLPIFYGGIMSAGVAFTLQIIGQRYAKPTHAAIIMSFESIFGALAGWLLLGEAMQEREIGGCIMMVVGMVVTQLKILPGR